MTKDLTTDDNPSAKTIASFIDETWRQHFVHYNIPPHMWEALRNYIEYHRKPGDFLTAVLSNDLRNAVLRADETNRHRLHGYILFLHNEAPAMCWGSPQAFAEWVAPKPEPYGDDNA